MTAFGNKRKPAKKKKKKKQLPKQRVVPEQWLSAGHFITGIKALVDNVINPSNEDLEETSAKKSDQRSLSGALQIC